MAHAENLTIMFTDMVGYSERTARQSRAQNQAMLRQHDVLLLPVIAGFGGRRVKSIGDGLLIAFRSPTDAVRCAMALIDALAEFNQPRPEPEQIHIRIALNAGEVRLEGRDIFGEAVNVAARVESVTPRDEIYFTEALYLAMNKAEVSSEPAGVHQLRGIPEPVRLYRVPPHHINRLVAGSERLEAVGGELPYGGMHRLPPEGKPLLTWTGLRHSAWSPGLRALLAVTLTALAALIWLGLARAPAPADDEGQAAEPSSAVTAKPERTAAVERLLREGDAALAVGRRSEAMAAYGHALDLEPALRDDASLANKLAAGLSWGSDTAMPVIRKHWSAAIADALARRATEPGRNGRYRAVTLLRENKQSERIDQGLLAIADLGEATSCAEKTDAATRLRQLRDRRALPVLKQTLGSGVGDWLGSLCFRSSVTAAIERIEQGTN
ncbi:MAG TPA: adenylate/guanylate cyclase domain-containing protein [Solimonas sp.]|nr:adenylate/guanylate cyclase domain-containing protein [Solimonas sp.]